MFVKELERPSDLVQGRPEHVRCVPTGDGEYSARYGQSWCGRTVYADDITSLEKSLQHPRRCEGGVLQLQTDVVDGASVETMMVRKQVDTSREGSFIDAGHALTEVFFGKTGRKICAECGAAMAAALSAGTYASSTAAPR